ncbi:putative secondary metabolism biosynthetic enzyme [Cytospora paraplurivora]|uniref:Secondary metabolism biosynthetic enzyme n=1 Tax=Cytospora paraplurivora TaxID=2898453 RepID=A0AAN9U0F0_9PEZI
MASTAASNFTTSTPPVPRDCHGSIAPQPIATPTYGPGGSFTIRCSTNISAPPDAVFAVLNDYSRWPEWNRFVRKATVNPDDLPSQGDSADATAIKKDMRLTFDVHMDPLDPGSSPRKENMFVTTLEPYEAVDGAEGKGWRVAWKSTSYPSLALRSERVQEVVDDGNGNTEYTCWETMYGPLAPVVKWTVGSKLETAFQCWSEDLKKRAEEGVRT